jgi:E3 ubiquitin-protein ligase ZNF598
MDLQAHMVEEHGNGMSSRDRRDAMRVQAEFTFEDTAAGARNRRGGGGGGRDAHPTHLASTPQAGPSRGGRRRDFGGHLTSDAPAAPPPPPQRPPSPPHGPLSDDPEVIQ